MNAENDKEYMAWYEQHGEMKDPNIEYHAWCAARDSGQAKLTASEKRIDLLQDENGILRREVISVSQANEKCFAELELWEGRANAQLEVTRVAVEIVNAPFQIYDGRTGQRGYRISTKEFEDLEKAVKQYVDAAKLEQEEQNNGTNANEK